MTRRDQKRLFREFLNQMRDSILERSDKWPDDWDGHELRELASYAFEYERDC